MKIFLHSQAITPPPRVQGIKPISRWPLPLFGQDIGLSDSREDQGKWRDLRRALNWAIREPAACPLTPASAETMALFLNRLTHRAVHNLHRTPKPRTAEAHWLCERIAEVYPELHKALTPHNPDCLRKPLRVMVYALVSLAQAGYTPANMLCQTVIQNTVKAPAQPSSEETLQTLLLLLKVPTSLAFAQSLQAKLDDALISYLPESAKGFPQIWSGPTLLGRYLWQLMLDHGSPNVMAKALLGVEEMATLPPIRQTLRTWADKGLLSEALKDEVLLLRGSSPPPVSPL